MSRIEIIGFLLCLIAVPAYSEMDSRSISVDGRERTFHLYVPKSAADQSRPLIIAFHGGLSNGEGMSRFSGLNETSDKEGFMVVYPDGSGRTQQMLTWNSGACRCYAQQKNIDDVRFVNELITLMIERYHTDARRVYVTGISNGAMMAYRVVVEIPERIAAVAVVAGTLDIDPSKVHMPKPVLHFHGTLDEYVPYEGGYGPRSATGNVNLPVAKTIQTWLRINGLDAKPVMQELPDRKDDGTRVIRYIYDGGQNEVVLYKIVGGGHTWPGRPCLPRVLGPTTEDISANEIMWEFFKRHSLSEDKGRIKVFNRSMYRIDNIGKEV